jgi:hypothetical protein
MPFMYTISHEDKIAYVTAHGSITMETINQVISDVAADPLFQPKYKVVVDLRDMEYSPSVSDMQSIASIIGEMKNAYQNKVAIVVSGKFHYGMAKMAAAYTEMSGVPMIDVFTDFEEARQWVMISETN